MWIFWILVFFLTMNYQTKVIIRKEGMDKCQKEGRGEGGKDERKGGWS